MIANGASTIFLENKNVVKITSSIFENNEALRGQTIILNLENNTLTVINSIFKSNKA